MKNIKSKLCALVLTAVSLATSAGALNAQNTFHSPDDLVLTFQNPGGTTGATQTVTVALGNATIFRDGLAFPPINIASTLSSTFGSNWFDATTLWAGVVGFRGTNGIAQLYPGTTDPYQTIYVSKARTSVGTAGVANSSISNIPLNSGTGITTGINAVKNQIETVGTTAQFVQATSASFIDDQNPFSSSGIQNAAYSNISNGVQGNFGSGDLGNNVLGAFGTVELALDIYRIQTRNVVAGQFGAGNATNTGNYLGTLTITRAGVVRFSKDGSAPQLTPPVITSATTASATVGTRFSYQITASNNPTTFSATMPSGAAGLTFNSTTGVISGTPTTAGLVGISMSATNDDGPGTAALTLTIAAAPVVKPTPVVTKPAAKKPAAKKPAAKKPAAKKPAAKKAKK